MARLKCTFKWAKVNILMKRLKCTFKWQDKSVRLNGKTNVYV